MQAEGRDVGQVSASGFLVHGTHVRLRVSHPLCHVDGIQVHHGERGGEDLGGGLRQPAAPPVPPRPVQVEPVDVDALRRGLGHLLFGHPGDVILQDDGVECPALVRPGNFLPHGRQETLGVKEPGHPEYVGAGIEYPLAELSVPLQELSEPEPQRGGFPRHLVGVCVHVCVCMYVC